MPVANTVIPQPSAAHGEVHPVGAAQSRLGHQDEEKLSTKVTKPSPIATTARAGGPVDRRARVAADGPCFKPFSGARN
jgi:hypothetical protein